MGSCSKKPDEELELQGNMTNFSKNLSTALFSTLGPRSCSRDFFNHGYGAPKFKFCAAVSSSLSSIELEIEEALVEVDLMRELEDNDEALRRVCLRETRVAVRSFSDLKR